MGLIEAKQESSSSHVDAPQQEGPTRITTHDIQQHANHRSSDSVHNESSRDRRQFPSKTTLTSNPSCTTSPIVTASSQHNTAVFHSASASQTVAAPKPNPAENTWKNCMQLSELHSYTTEQGFSPGNRQDISNQDLLITHESIAPLSNNTLQTSPSSNVERDNVARPDGSSVVASVQSRSDEASFVLGSGNQMLPTAGLVSSAVPVVNGGIECASFVYPGKKQKERPVPPFSSMSCDPDRDSP